MPDLRLALPFLLPALLVAASLPAQTGTAGTEPQAGAPLPDGAPAAMVHVARKALSDHAHFLASDELGGRFTTSQGQNQAADYIADHFKQWGLKPLGDRRTFFQSYPLEKTFLDPSTALTFGQEKLAAPFAVVPGGPADKVNLAGRFVFCGNGSPDEIPAGLKGRIPVVVAGKARGQGQAASMMGFQRLEAMARELGGKGAAGAVLCLLEADHALADRLAYQALLPDHPHLKYKGQPPPFGFKFVAIPVMVLGPTAAGALLQHLGLTVENGTVGGEADPKASGRLQITVKTDAKASARNVVACREGKGNKREAIVFSAHMDHMGTRLDGDAFNGADDNASGTAGLLAIAEAFARAEEPPDRTVIFLSVSGEELGLWGSDWFADHPTWPLGQIVANINIDMIGRITDLSPTDVISVTPSRQHGKYSTLVRRAHGLAAKFGLTFSSGDTYYERSDHYNFAKNGVPVVFFCDGEHGDYHKVTDTADKLDYAKMERVARLAFWLGWETAQDKARPHDLGVQQDW